jgi:hypothetical protein
MQTLVGRNFNLSLRACPMTSSRRPSAWNGVETAVWNVIPAQAGIQY